MTPSGDTAPSLPPVAFCVGVSGHRPNRLQHADLSLLSAQVTRALQTVQAAVRRCAAAHTPPLPPACRLLSSLAEGADRLVADAALPLGFTLGAPLPFPQPVYEEDFTAPESLAEFRRLLATAASVFALPDVTPGSPRALGYRAAGELVLGQCDLLLAVWDGAPAAGIGGTPEVIDRALEAGLPVLVIEAAAPHVMRLLPGSAVSSDTHADPLPALTAVVEALLMPSPSQLQSEAEYVRESWPTRIPVSSFLFTRLLGDRRLQLPRTPAYATAGAEIRSPLLRPYFAWTDALATGYGERSRSAALHLQLLASLAVLSGLLSIPFDAHVHVLRTLACLELGATLTLVGVALVAARRPWHPRWLRYRALAEQIRSLDLLVPLGETLRPPIAAQIPSGQQSPGDFGQELFRAIAREAGLPSAQVNADFLTRERKAIRSAVAAQAAFQHRAAERYGTTERTLHRLGLGLFSVAVLLSIYDVARSFGVTDLASVWITTSAALLPALGATLAGIAAQGEYQRLAARAESMSQTLDALAARLTAAHAGSLPELARAARNAAAVLTSEVREWQALVALRKPSLPT